MILVDMKIAPLMLMKIWRQIKDAMHVDMLSPSPSMRFSR